MPKTVAATMEFLQLLRESHFSVLEDFHPGYEDSVTLVSPDTKSAITVVIVESDGD